MSLKAFEWGWLSSLTGISSLRRMITNKLSQRLESFTVMVVPVWPSPLILLLSVVITSVCTKNWFSSEDIWELLMSHHQRKGTFGFSMQNLDELLSLLVSTNSMCLKHISSKTEHKLKRRCKCFRFLLVFEICVCESVWGDLIKSLKTKSASLSSEILLYAVVLLTVVGFEWGELTLVYMITE